MPALLGGCCPPSARAPWLTARPRCWLRKPGAASPTSDDSSQEPFLSAGRERGQAHHGAPTPLAAVLINE